MQKKALKYIVSIILLIVVAYNSIYFKKLDEVKAASTSKQFDAANYARNFYIKKLLPNLDKAIELNTLLSLVKSDPDKAFKDHSHALGIGNIRYFLVKGEGTITGSGENDVAITMKSDSSKKEIKVA